MTPQEHQYQHGDTVKVTCELGYSVDTYDATLSMSEYMTTCQISGVWSPRYNCEHTYTCNASSAWVSVGSNTDMPRCIEVCGKTFTDSSSAGRIWGGEQAKLGEIPWQLFIRQPRGGASLITDRWAVTAAHVVDGLEEIPFDLYGGVIDGKKTQNRPSDVVVMGTAKIIIHPSYVKGIKQRTNFDNDIALIRLASRVTLGPNLLPICLPEAGADVRENEQGTVSGWGSTEVFEKSQMLRYAHISGYSLRECQSTPRLQDTPMVFTDNMFCAGSSTGKGKDSCRGDSGGPFILPALGNGNRDNRGPYRLIGIVSWGPGCDGTEFKGYYTKVERYVKWIKETIESVEKEERAMNK
ncbi:complement C1s subcomponent [Diretmus argenteus]